MKWLATQEKLEHRMQYDNIIGGQDSGLLRKTMCRDVELVSNL